MSMQHWGDLSNEELAKRIDEVGEHLRRQDTNIAAIKAEVGTHSEIVARIARALKGPRILLRVVAAGLASGACFEIGKIVIDRIAR